MGEWLVILAALGGAAWAGWQVVRLRRLHAELGAAKAKLEEELRRHEHALHQERAQREAVFNSMVEGVLLVDSSGKVTLVNQALERLCGLAQDCRGRTVIEAFRHHEVQQLVSQVQTEGRVIEAELTLNLPTEVRVQINGVSLWDPDGKVHGTLLVFHDLTHLKQLESARRDFVANVSHELRTPLSLIKGYVETLIDGAKDDPAVAARFLHTIERHADRLAYLIEDLLTLSRLESGQATLNLQTVELRLLVERVLEDFRKRAMDKTIALDNQIEPGLSVEADVDRLQQVWFNLVDNAIKYGRPGGTVELGSRRLDSGQLEFWVKDDGPGIPEEAQARIFERFYRVDRARSRDLGGTGLGLAIVKHVVQSHGGEVRLESRPGQGAAFFFTLPVRERSSS